MANSNYTHEMQTTQTKDFDFIFVEEEALSHFYQASKSVPSAMKTTVSPFDREALNRFHDEFKSLVLAANQSYLENESIAWDDTTLNHPIEPHEIEWMEVAVSALKQTKPVVAQQTIKPLTGPPLGMPPPVEKWVVKIIAVLVSLNVLFAGLIVSGARINDCLNWFPL